MVSRNTELGGSREFFPDTVWTAVIKAKDRESGEFKKNLNELVSTYWKPVYVYIRKAWNKTNDEAKDLTQDFFSRFLEKDMLEAVQPGSGRFRFYVRRVLQNFLKDQRKAEKTQKRGGAAMKISFEGLDYEPILKESSGDPGALFDKEWARAVLSKCIGIMRAALTKKDKGIYFEVFRLVNLEADNVNTMSYEEIARKLDIKVSDISNHLRYTKKLLQRIMREEVSKYVTDASEIDDELRFLFSVSSR